MSAHTHDMVDPSDIESRISRARRVVEGAGERFTPLRAHVLELIIQNRKAVKAYDLLSQLSPELGSPKPPTVYRALDFLSRHGLIHRVEALNAFIACDHMHAHDHNNDGDPCAKPHRHLAAFFICDICFRVQEHHTHEQTEGKPEGFQIHRSVIEHYGTCADCAA